MKKVRLSQRQQEAANAVRAISGQKPILPPARKLWEIYNSHNGPVQIVDNNGVTVIQLGPHEIREIDEAFKNQIEVSDHFKGLKAQNKIRLV
jgi:Icc-related predicted phosphoesterase